MQRFASSPYWRSALRAPRTSFIPFFIQCLRRVFWGKISRVTLRLSLAPALHEREQPRDHHEEAQEAGAVGQKLVSARLRPMPRKSVSNFQTSENSNGIMKGGLNRCLGSSPLCVRKGWSSRTCKRAKFLLLICQHVVKALIGGYVGASSVAEADFGPYGNLGQVVKAVIALNVNDEKISHGSQLRLTVAQGEWTDPREIEGPSTLRHPHAPSHSGRTTVLCDCANQLLGWDTSS